MAERTYNKVVILSENTANDLQLTEYLFNFYVKKFLTELLDDPVNTVPAPAMVANGLGRKELIDVLMDNDIIRREQRLRDKDEAGNPTTVKMNVKFKMPRKGLIQKLSNLYTNVFKNLNETDCASVGGDAGFMYDAPFPGKGEDGKKDPAFDRSKGDIAVNRQKK